MKVREEALRRSCHSCHRTYRKPELHRQETIRPPESAGLQGQSAAWQLARAAKHGSDERDASTTRPRSCYELLERARIMDDFDSPRVTLLLSEAVLRQVIGGPQVMCEQL
ncbi:Scr1 family TA system antitoxin-like transcriptional regulator [Streptomyces sp. NPDC020362]|uniref:Scr1 family TA system antitoxin-like transcriptional regulator n=1 Tax=unclassified Streptomyces TaxID=2593676 RepID=UPI0033F080EA